MPPTVNTLPVEVVENIAALLDLRNICNLRLASQSLSAAASQGHFKTFFVARTLSLGDAHRTRRFIANVSQSALASSLQRLTVVGSVSQQDIPANAQADEQFRQLLCRALGALKDVQGRRELMSIRLEVEDDPDVDLHAPGATFAAWKRRSVAAVRVFKMTMHAIQKTQLQLQSLNVFGDTTCCSLPCNELLRSTDLERLDYSLSPITSLVLNISPQRNLEIEKDDGTSKYSSIDDPAESVDSGRQRKSMLVGFLRSMLSLKDVDLRWYRLRKRKETASDRELSTWMDSLPYMLPKTIESVTLRGFQVADTSLLSLLSAPTIRKVSLRKVTLHTGEWRSVFDCLTSVGSTIRHIYLEDLFEDGGRLIYFPSDGTPDFPSKGGSAGANRMDWSKGDEPVQYAFAHGRALGSGTHRNWLLSRAQEVGPPDLLP